VRRATLLALCLGTLACGSNAPGHPSPNPSPGADPSSRSGFTYRGLNHVSWWHDEYQYAGAQVSREQLTATNANWAGVLVTWYMEARDSTAIAPVALRTPTDESVVAAIRDLHGRGVKVMLKPHVDVLDGSWRGTIRPADATAWFASYDAFMTRQAALAQASGVEMLCVGTELATMSDARYLAQWSTIIGHVRTQYRGLLTYAANAVSAGDEFTSVSFWAQLDLAGLDAYTPLTDKADPSRDELVQGWSRNRNGENMVAAFRNWHASHGKPVLMTELGYRSADGTNRAPWDWQASAPYDPGEQADCYDAAFRAWAPEAAWMRGIIWWDWDVPVPSANDTGYTPRNKPAEQVLVSWQSP
jgi:glycosyl hydrolase family 113